MDTFPKILQVPEVSSVLGKAQRTIQLWAAGGTLKAFKIGRSWRFRDEDIKQFLQIQMDRDPD